MEKLCLAWWFGFRLKSILLMTHMPSKMFLTNDHKVTLKSNTFTKVKSKSLIQSVELWEGRGGTNQQKFEALYISELKHPSFFFQT